MLGPAGAHAGVADGINWLAFVKTGCAGYDYYLLAGTEENQHLDNKKNLLLLHSIRTHLVRVASFECKAGDLPQS